MLKESPKFTISNNLLRGTQLLEEIPEAYGEIEQFFIKYVRQPVSLPIRRVTASDEMCPRMEDLLGGWNVFSRTIRLFQVDQHSLWSPGGWRYVLAHEMGHALFDFQLPFWRRYLHRTNDCGSESFAHLMALVDRFKAADKIINRVMAHYIMLSEGVFTPDRIALPAAQLLPDGVPQDMAFLHYYVRTRGLGATVALIKKMPSGNNPTDKGQIWHQMFNQRYRQLNKGVSLTEEFDRAKRWYQLTTVPLLENS